MRWALYIGLGIALMVAIIAAVGAMLPKGHIATRAARFRQSAVRVFDVISGPPDWRPDVKRFESLPAHGGNPMWREVDSHGQAITFERTEFDPPRRLRTTIADPKLPFGGSWIHELTETSGGTLLRVTEQGEVYNPFFRFISRFILGHHASLEKYLLALGQKFGETVQVEE